MPDSHTDPTTPNWVESPTLIRLVAAVLLIAVVVEGYFAIFRRENDFVWHLALGQAFLDGDFVGNVHQDKYPIGRWMLDAVPASMNHYVGRAFCYGLAIAGLAATVWMWNRMAQARLPISAAAGRAAAALALGVLYPYVIRDLDDCGIHLLLVFLLTCSAYALFRRRSAWSGFWLAWAITYKVTPIYFLGLMVWKREWRAAAWTVAFAVGVNLLPAFHLGWKTTVDRNLLCLNVIASASRTADYSSTLETPRHQNQALPFGMARYLQSFPKGDPRHLDHPCFVQFGDLSPKSATTAIRTALIFAAAIVAWKLRRRWGSGAGQADIASEWAFVMALTPLMSPLCWLQHLVLVVPAVLLAMRERLVGSAPKWRRVGLVFIGTVTLLLQRDVVGRELSILVLSYKLDTMAVLVAAAMALCVPSEPPAIAAREVADEPRAMAA